MTLLQESLVLAPGIEIKSAHNKPMQPTRPPLLASRPRSGTLGRLAPFDGLSG